MKGLLWANFGNTSPWDIGRMRRLSPAIPLGAWIDAELLSWLDWAGDDIGFMGHNMLGQWRERMHLDARDYAVAMRADWMLPKLSSDAYAYAWRKVTARTQVLAYMGRVANTGSTRRTSDGTSAFFCELPNEPLALAPIIDRNIEPYVRADMRICLDNACEATPTDIDALTLRRIDLAGNAPAMIEAAPRNWKLGKRVGVPGWPADVEVDFSQWRLLCDRDCAVSSDFYWTRMQPDSDDKWFAAGWGTPDYIRGTIYVLVQRPRSGFTLQQECLALREAGVVPVVSLALVNRSTMKPEELFG